LKGGKAAGKERQVRCKTEETRGGGETLRGGQKAQLAPNRTEKKGKVGQRGKKKGSLAKKKDFGEAVEDRRDGDRQIGRVKRAVKA